MTTSAGLSVACDRTNGANPVAPVAPARESAAKLRTAVAPFLAGRGQLAVTSFEPTGSADALEAAAFAKKYAERLASKPNIFGKVRVLVITSPAAISLGPDGSADLVVTFRNFHNWVKAGIAADILTGVQGVQGVLSVRVNG
jgi:predicted methyltransferase